MSSPALARLDDDGHRFYTFPDESGVLRPYYSSTTLLDLGMPNFLHTHYAKMSSDLAYADVVKYGKRALGRWEKSGRKWVAEQQAEGGLVSLKADKLTREDYILRWLKGAAVRHRDAARDRGSAVHDIAEDTVKELAAEATRLIIAGEKADAILERAAPERRPYVASWLAWVHDFRPRFLMTEASVFNPIAGYAGTLDSGIEILVIPPGESEARWVTVLGDYKTGSRIMPKVALQLASYQRATFVGLPNYERLPLPAFEFAAVLLLTPKGYDFRWVRTDDDVFNAFLYVAQVAKFQIETSRTVIGERIVPDLTDALAASLIVEGVA